MKRYDLNNVIRGDINTLFIPAQYLDSGYLANPYSFVVKATQNPTDNRLIAKLNTLAGGDNTQISSDANGVYIHLLNLDTAAFTSIVYFYDVYNPSSGITEVGGNFILNFDVQTPYDGNVISSPYQPMLHGTTTQRTSFGLTLKTTDRLMYFDDSMDSAFWWNGINWV